jgi:PAS domain S-box-containing protein
LIEVHLVAGKEDEQLRFQARLLDAVGQSVIATDLEGKVIYWNRAAEALYGWSSEEALGLQLRDLTLAEDSLDRAEEVASELRAGRASGARMDLTCPFWAPPRPILTTEETSWA